MKPCLIACVGLVLAVVPAWGQDKPKDKASAKAPPENPKLAIGQPAPEIVGHDIDGKALKLGSSAKAEPT